MYRELFDPVQQEKMTTYFAEVLAAKGTIRLFKKNTLIDPLDAENVYIVLSGECKQGLVSADGGERTFFRLTKGTIFGEMDYFDGDRTCEITYVTEKAQISIVSKLVLEKELGANPEVYRYFIHSITRKYRLLMLQLADVRFNDSIGILASTFLRMASMQEGYDVVDRTLIERPYKHDELASSLGLSRPTVTNGLCYLKEKGLISMEGKHIVIEKVSELRALTNTYW